MAKEPKNISIEKSYANAYRDQAKFKYENVKNVSEWGEKEAKDDGFKLQTIPKAKDASAPQFKNDQPLNGPGNGDVPNNWVRGGGRGQAEGKPSFDKYQVRGRNDDCGRQPSPQPPRRLKPLPAK